MDKQLDLFSFSDYRSFIKAWLAEARARKASNLSRLAERIGVHTSLLAHVLSGAKNLSFEQATELCEAMNLTFIERDFFFALLQIERAGSVKLKKYWLEKKEFILAERLKVKSRVGIHHELSAEDKAIYYSSWIYGAFFVSTAIDDGQTLEQIAGRFSVGREKAEEILNLLCRTGICELHGAVYRMGKSVVYLNNDSPLVVKHHTNWRIKAIQKMDNREQTELFFTSPLSISREDFGKIREILAKTVQTSMAICKDSPAEEVYCLNIDFFKAS